MKQRPRPTPPPPRYAQPYTPPPRPDCAATLPLPRMTRARALRLALTRARWWVHGVCGVLIATGAVAVNQPTALTRAVGIAFIVTGSGASGYRLHTRRP